MSSNEGTSASESYRMKECDILRCCNQKDIDTLVALACSDGGLLRDDLRKLAWPLLLGCEREPTGKNSRVDDLPRHRDEEQVKKHPMLCYFQGYHDIAQVLLLVLGPKDSASAVERISLFRIRDYMLPSLSPSIKHLQLLPALISLADPVLYGHLSGTQPFFALAATLTLYAHDIQEYSDIARLYDFILSHEPVVSIYLFASIILSRRKELLEIPTDEPEMIHFTLSKLPQPLDLEMLIGNAMKLYLHHSPESLPFRAWKKISQHSVLKTSRDLSLHTTTLVARDLFEKQADELRREEMKQKAVALLKSHSRTFRSVALSIFVGILSYWIMKNNYHTLIRWPSCNHHVPAPLVGTVAQIRSIFF
ncbi:GTPase-activating protein gyp8 [Ophidiomyces ophidiicola]|nr:GTPase-activating protein gyp8 [Ophidiomyces ophidiicola]